MALGIVLAVVVIILGVLAIQAGAGGSGGDSGEGPSVAGSAGTSPNAGSAAPPATSVPVSIPPRAAPAGPTFTGRVRITNLGIDIDEVTPESGVGTNDVFLSRPGELYFYARDVAIWNDTTTPSYEQCDQVASLQSLSSSEKYRFTYSEGEGICLRTNHSLAFMRIDSPAGAEEAIQADMIRWTLRQ